MRRLLLLGLALLSTAPVCVYALSLGNLELRSALHQPLDARVAILSATGEEIETLRVNVAPASEFARAGVSYAGVLTQLKFEIQQTRKGPDYIRITSQDPIKEPFLNFLVEANWAKGRLIREYTALLDPPLYDPSRRVSWQPAQVNASPAKVTEPAPAPAAPAERKDMAVAQAKAPAPAPATQPAAVAPTAPSPAASAAPVSNGSYPTLWSAATSMRPNNAVSMQQMMLALLRTNPEAFIRGNINLLKKGYVLKMPEQSEMTAISRAEAIAEVQKHHALWREYRERGAVAAPRQPEGATSVAATPTPETSAPAESPAAVSGDDAKLKLIASNEANGEGAAGGASKGEGANASGELALTKETLESKNRENEELRSQLKESEEIIEKLKSRVALQDDQLAELQRQVSVPAGETAPTPAMVPEAAPQPTAPMAGAAEPWRSLDNEVQAPTYPFPDHLDEAAAASSTTEEPAAETPVEASPDATATPLEETTPPEATAEGTPEEAPSIETPAEEPAASVDTESPAEQTAATVEAPAAETPVEPAPDESPPATAEAESPAPATEAPPAADGGGIVSTVNDIFGRFLPKSLLESIPGGGLTVLGVLLAALGGLATVLLRRRATPAPAHFPSTADTDFEDDHAFDAALSDVGVPVPDMAAPEALADDELFAATSEPASTQTTRITAPAPARETTEEDPLAEVNVYLAYERFDEAERLIKEAIASHPGEHKYKLRLLEVYYSSNNRQAYEAAARDLHAGVGGQGPLWDSAVAMWREMSPNRELFAGGEDIAATLSETAQRQFVDITAAAAEEATSRTVTSAVKPGFAAMGEASVGQTATELPGESAFPFDSATPTEQDFDMLDITASSDVKQADSDILDISANPVPDTASPLAPESASIEGASDAVNELLSLTKSGAVVSAEPMGGFLESSLDFGAFPGPGSESPIASTLSPDDMLDFDLGTGEATISKAADNNVVDFPARAEPPVPADALSTMIDVAPMPESPPSMEFDIGGLDLALDSGSAEETRGPPPSLDLALDTRGSSEVTMGDIDSLSLDEDTVRLFENDLAATNTRDTAPIFGADGELTATSNDFGSATPSFRESPTGGGDEFTLDGDDLTLDDITKSLEETVGSRSKGSLSNFETVDMAMEADSMLDQEQTAELFENDIRGSSAEDTLGSATATLGRSVADDIDTKLNLAKAYIELGDASGARSILDEVVREGGEAKRDEAQRLLRELTT